MIAGRSRKRKTQVPESGLAPITIVELVALHGGSDKPLLCEAQFNVDAGITRVAQVIHAVYLDYKNVLGVEPVAWPRVNESERIAAVLEAAITVIGLADTKPVFLPKIGPVTVVRNAPAIATPHLLYRLSLL
jgi:hypothetical protein